MPLEGKIKVAIADDHPLVREGIKRLVDYVPEIVLVGEASNGQEAIELTVNKQPDILILDLQMPVMDGTQVIDYLYKNQSSVIILVLSAQDDFEIVQETLSKGAWGYYLKEDAPQYLVKAIRQAAKGAKKSCSPRFSGLGFASV